MISRLRSRVQELSGKTQSTEAGAKTASRRRVSDILVRAGVLREERLSRQKLARKIAHTKKMKALAVQEADLWPKLTQLIDQKKTWAYEEAIGILKNLSSLAAYRKDSEGFCARFHKLYEPYQKLSGLRWRLKEAGLLPEPNQQR